MKLKDLLVNEAKVELVPGLSPEQNGLLIRYKKLYADAVSKGKKTKSEMERRQAAVAAKENDALIKDLERIAAKNVKLAAAKDLKLSPGATAE